MTVLEPVTDFLMHMYDMAGAHRVLSLTMIMRGADRPRKPVLRVLDKLTREGYLEQVADTPIPNGRREYGPARRNPQWRVMRDLSERPRLPKPRKKTLRDTLWRLIRAKRHFTKADLALISGAKPATVDEYVRMLENNGHVRRTGKDGGRVTYMLVSRQVERPGGMEKGETK